jgi:hypothetical protein
MTTNPVRFPANIDRLFELLPTVYRQRDLEEGSPLQMLLRVIAEQVNVVENDIAQLYDNWFIESCEDWVVPYIADLIGFQPVAPPDLDDPPSAALDMVLVPRREVANTIRYRRRKGTLALLRDLAKAVSGWPAMVVEFDHRVNVTQSLDHLHPGRGLVADLRNAAALDLVGSAFDRLSHSVELRELDSLLSPGRYNSAGVGVLIGSLNSYSVTRSLAYCQEEVSDECFTFSVLGNDMPLFARGDAEAASVDDPIKAFPMPIRRLVFSHESGSAKPAHASTHFYGEEKGLAIWARGWSDCDPAQPVPASRIVPADLTDWRYRPRENHIAVDPELGRIAFPQEQLPPGDVHVSYNYGAAADLGGGEYPRAILNPGSAVTVYEVGAEFEFSTIHSACERWLEEKPRYAAIEIADSGVYQEQIHLALAATQHLELRAASGVRPIVLVKDVHASRPDAVTICGGERSRFSLDGVMIAGRGIHVSGLLETVAIRHTTLVPGWSLQHDCKPRRTEEPSLALENLTARIAISHSILGGIQILQESAEADPLRLTIANSILDAHHPDFLAVSAPNGSIAQAVLRLRNCTVMGAVETHSVELAENTIFLGEVRVARKQQGCLRFCYVPTKSRTPRRYHCQPDLVEQAAMQEATQQGLSAEDAEALRHTEELRVRPQFLSGSFGTPDYYRLNESCAVEISGGADDQSEMGVYHDLFQPQRAANLRTRLSDYTPAGSNVGVIFVT